MYWHFYINLYIDIIYNVKIAMLDNVPIFVDQKKRVKIFSRLNLEEVAVLKSSDNAEYIAKEFDRIFLKLQRLIRLWNNKNETIKSEIEMDTNNLIKNFLNYLKWKALPRKIRDEQWTFFRGICTFINFFEWDSYFAKIHNSIPKTSIREFNKKSVWEQFFQMSYWREWWLKWMPEWWDCGYRTILLYNFFNKLKEAWLDMDIKLFRYKNLDDTIVKFPSMRHSWLVVTFQWEDYFIDHEWIQISWDREPIVRNLQPYLDIAKKQKDERTEKFFENFKHENMRETDKVIFFDNTEDFLKHVEKYPPYQKVAFYLPRWEWEMPDKINYEFGHNCIWIAANWHWHTYYLKDNNITKKGFPENIVKKLAFEKDKNWIHPITEQGEEMFRNFFSLVTDKIDTDWLYNNYTANGKWESIIADFMWTPKVIMIQK